MADRSQRLVCRFLEVSRSALTPRPRSTRPRAPLNPHIVARVRFLIQTNPTHGYRLLTAWLRRDGLTVNRKRVYRLLKLKGWLVHQRSVTPRPRVQGMVSRATASNQRWAMDVTHIPCGQDGWGHLAAVIDCHDREVVGFEFALRGRAKEAERALEAACITRFGTVRPSGPTPMVRSDNGLIFQSRRFRAACKDYRLRQEFITPYTPEQNGIIERFFRTLKEECVWLHTFTSYTHARREVMSWIHRDNTRRPHAALGSKSPAEFRAQQLTQVA